MRQPSVSVIIPSYNHAAYVGECVASVLAQDYENLEVLVVDDGSTDETRSVVEQFGSRVRYQYQENQGQAVARAWGLSHTDGELVCLLDSDDRWAPELLAESVPQFENAAIGVTFANYSKIDKVGQVFRENCFEEDRPWILPLVDSDTGSPWTLLPASTTRRLYLEHFPHTPSGALFRRSWIQHRPDPRVRRGDDYLFFTANILASRCQVAFSTDRLWQWRVHGANIRQKNSNYAVLLKNDIFAKRELLRLCGETLSRSERGVLLEKISEDYFDWGHGATNDGEWRSGFGLLARAVMAAPTSRFARQSLLEMSKVPFRSLGFRGTQEPS